MAFSNEIVNVSNSDTFKTNVFKMKSEETDSRSNSFFLYDLSNRSGSIHDVKAFNTF
eukprot:UN15191